MKNKPKSTGDVSFKPTSKITDATLREDHEQTPFENFEDLTTKLLRIPKREVDQKRAEQEKARRREQD
jgi:hypothetical protein